MLLKRSATKRQMSIEKPQQKLQPKNFNDQSQFQKIVHTISSTKMHLLCRQAWGDGLDTSLLWKCLLPVAPLTLRKQHIVFRDTTYIISNWTQDDFPSVLYITADDVTGYFTGQMVASNRVAALELQQVNVILDDADVRTYQLIYKINDPISWQIPTIQTQLKFRLQSDDTVTPVILPLPSPLTLNFELRRE